MKFMLLVHHDEAAFDQLAEETQREMLDQSIELTHELYANGQYLSASPLQPTTTASVVRVRAGKHFITDGPFIETREQIAGYFLVEAKNLDEAIAIALRVPGAHFGTVEVRPVKEISGLPGE